MYRDAAYWRDKTPDVDDDYEDLSRPLIITNSGTYKLFSRPKLYTDRPKGRKDYQFLYVVSGKAHFYFDGVKEIVSAGNIVIYRPGESQRYWYCGNDKTEVFWVHFTGSDVKEFFEKYGITREVHVVHIGESYEYKKIFQQMIKELKLCKEDYEQLLANHLHNLMITIHRSVNRKLEGRNQAMGNEIDEAIAYFHMNYNKPINIEEYAKSIHMSVRWFIRNFKEHTKTTPAQYILSLRIINAKALLMQTDYDVKEIANIVGYENAFYFSRIFKKQTGLSPTEYRKQTV